MESMELQVRSPKASTDMVNIASPGSLAERTAFSFIPIHRWKAFYASHFQANMGLDFVSGLFKVFFCNERPMC